MFALTSSCEDKCIFSCLRTRVSELKPFSQKLHLTLFFYNKRLLLHTHVLYILLVTTIIPPLLVDEQFHVRVAYVAKGKFYHNESM